MRAPSPRRRIALEDDARRCRRRRRQHLLVHLGRHRGVHRHDPRARRASGCPQREVASSSSPAACRPATATSSPALLPEVSAFVPVAERASLLERARAVTGVAPQRCDRRGRRRARSAGASAYLQISDGCHRACAYCTIPSIRGPYVSRRCQTSSPRRASSWRSARARSSSSARTSPRTDATSTVRRRSPTSCARSPQCRASTGCASCTCSRTASPTTCWPRWPRTPTSCRYLDMPLQHASAPRAARDAPQWGRGEPSSTLLDRIRDALPDVVLRTTLIAGFPGETQPRRSRSCMRLPPSAPLRLRGRVRLLAGGGHRGRRACPTRSRSGPAAHGRSASATWPTRSASSALRPTSARSLEVLVEGVDPEDERRCRTMARTGA